MEVIKMNSSDDINSSFQEESYWSEAWIRHVENYIASVPRCGYWMESRFSQKSKILEIAGGSCRDSRYLSEKGYDAMGSDFDQKTLSFLEKNYPSDNFIMRRENAFEFSFQNNEFDESFSNGFWVCFDNNDDIYALIKEQERITKKYLISLVHNGENNKLVKSFKDRSENDDLYKIRFFDKQELVDIIEASGIPYKSIKILKFGGPVDRLLSRKVKSKLPAVHNVLKKIALQLYDLQPWSMVERIAIVVEME